MATLTPTKIKAVLITNVPAPYRVPMLRIVGQQPDIDLEVIYCAPAHIDPSIDDEAHGFKPHFLTGRYWAMQKRFMHIDPSVFAVLKRLKPDVVITTGYIPTFLFAFLWTLGNRAVHIAMTDGTEQIERDLTWVHRFVRRMVFKRTTAFVGASSGSLALFRSYGLPEDRFHLSRLCVDNSRFNLPSTQAPFDFIYSGRFVPHKRPLFALQVAKKVAEIIGRKVTINFLGKGPLDAELRAYSNTVESQVGTVFSGYVSQAELPAQFAGARIFLFPTEWDCWGLVGNEACAAGLPTIVSPVAGVAGDLIRDGENGFVRALDVESWAQVACSLLQDPVLYKKMGTRAREMVTPYTFEAAATGLSGAIRQAAEPLMQRRICIIQPVMKAYRVPFFTALSVRLKREGMILMVVYGTPWREEQLRGDNVDLPEPLGKRIESYFYAGKLLFIPVLKPILQADFVIVEHANKNVLNFPLALANRLGLKKVGYWGHGSNRQGDRNSTVETFKRMSLHWSDWWFAYTQSAAQYVATQGFDRSRITTVGNAVDTGRLTTKIQAVTELDRASMLTKLSLSAKGKRLIYCGSLYENKRLDLMLPTADALHSAMPDIQFIVIGGGPLAADVQEFAASRPWVRYVGPQFGMEKATLLTLANVWLNPGLVGLGILDAFCAGLPLVTTDLPLHSPEIEYLVHGYNGLMVSPSVAALTSEICKLFESPEQLAHLRHGALASAKEYSMESMVENFTQGILQWSK